METEHKEHRETETKAYLETEVKASGESATFGSMHSMESVIPRGKAREPYSISQWAFKEPSAKVPMKKPSSELMIYENTCIVYPRQESVIESVKSEPIIYAELIEDVLYEGEILCLTGPMHAYKSICLIALAVAIANGKRWLNHPCKKGKVLYINAGMSKVTFQRKLEDVAKAMHVKGPLLNLSVWHVTPRPVDDWIHINELEEMMGKEHFDAIIIDPIHHFRLPTSDHVRNCCKALTELANHRCAAVIFSRHNERFFDCDKRVEVEADVLMSLEPPDKVYGREQVEEATWYLAYEFYHDDADYYDVWEDPIREPVVFEYPLYKAM